jgi:Tfp pilus assembly protein PilX
MKIPPHFNISTLKRLFPTISRTLARVVAPNVRAQAGFTLLLAALIASIVLALGSSIFTIAQKQVKLSTLGRDSQFAFYTADTGAECALYWDVRYNLFSTTTTATSATCDGRPLTITGIGASFPYTARFQIDLFTDQSTGYCTEVTVTKDIANPHTVIHADGYNVTCAAKDSNARALQRSVELQY